MKMCQAFAKNGHNVTLIVPDRDSETLPGVNDIYSYYGVEPCFEVERVPWLRIRGRGYLYGYLAGRRARRIGPDLVYGRNTAGCYAAALLGLQTVYEVHQPAQDLGGLGELLFRLMKRRTALRRIVAITDALAKHYIDTYRLASTDVLVAPDGADPIPPGTVPVRFDGDNGVPHIGYIGHLYKGRGVELVLQLARRLPAFCFHIVGGTAEEVTEKYDIHPHDLPGNIVFHGFLRPSEVDRYRIAFDVLLAPYQRTVHVSGGCEKMSTANWMSPLKLFEYMAAGTPIVCSDLPVIREVLRDSHNALLCDPEDTEAWASALIRIRKEASLASRLAQAALKDFTQKYTWNRRAFKVLDELVL